MSFLLMNVLQELFPGDIGELSVLQGCVLQTSAVDGSLNVLMEAVSAPLDIHCTPTNRTAKMVIQCIESNTVNRYFIILLKCHMFSIWCITHFPPKSIDKIILIS